MADFSKRHKLIGELFSIPRSAAEWEPFRLTPEQVEFYHQQGYLPKVPMLNATQVAVMRRELEVFFSPDHSGRELWYEYHTNESNDPENVLFHALGAWRIGVSFHDVLWNPAFTMPASQLLGGAVRFWHDQLFCKPPRHGGVVAWHQDYSYWTRTRPMAHLTCWIGLDDSTVDNGCVHYIPGSHKWPLLPVTRLAGDMDGIREALNDEQWQMFQNPVAVELKAGEATFHHPLMVHGSFANRTDRPRRATVINALAEGVRSDSNEPLLGGVPVVPAGEPIGGQFFPLLIDPTAIAG